MPRPRSAETDAKLVEQAQRRSAIHAFLENNEGEHEPAAIAQAIGIEARTAGTVLSHMAREKMIPSPRIKGTKKFYRGGPANGQAGAAEGAKRSYTRAKVAGSKDVELVVAGTLIVIGRSKTTGRLRITLEDAGT